VSSATRISRDDGFGRYSRFYTTPDGLVLPSVTTILDVIGKPALVGWAAKTERELCLQVAGELFDAAPMDPKMSKPVFLATLASRIGKEKAHRRKLREAGTIGTQLHERIEWTLRRELQQEAGPEPVLDQPALLAYMAWEDWRKQANLVPRWIEQVVWSVQYGYAGTLDLFCDIDVPGGRGGCVIDWKSGKAIYPEARLQNAAYSQGLVELGQTSHPVHGMVVRLPKTENDPVLKGEAPFDVCYISPQEQAVLLKVFRAVLELWKWQEGLRAQAGAA
jgi:hypothetical protein